MVTKIRSGLTLIRKYEGCKLNAYLCSAGVWTIGWGRTKGVKKGDTCSQAQADAWLNEEYDAFEAQVLKHVKVPLTANQLGALVSFSYNVGTGALASSTLLKLLNSKNYKGAAEQFSRWNKAAGKILAGLTKRRTSERALFLS